MAKQIIRRWAVIPVAEPTDRDATFSDKDFRLGLNAAQTALGAVAQPAGATVKR